MHVEIIQRPEGEAPAWVRDAWIGLRLPVLHPVATEFSVLGVLSRPTSRFGLWWAKLRGTAYVTRGYWVDSATALAVLEHTNPQAAKWWRDNLPELFVTGQTLVFDEAACCFMPAANDG